MLFVFGALLYFFLHLIESEHITFCVFIDAAKERVSSKTVDDEVITHEPFKERERVRWLVFHLTMTLKIHNDNNKKTATEKKH